MRIFLIVLGGVAALAAGSFAWNAIRDREEEEPERTDGKKAKAKRKPAAAKAKPKRRKPASRRTEPVKTEAQTAAP